MNKNDNVFRDYMKPVGVKIEAVKDHTCLFICRLVRTVFIALAIFMIFLGVVTALAYYLNTVLGVPMDTWTTYVVSKDMDGTISVNWNVLKEFLTNGLFSKAFWGNLDVNMKITCVFPFGIVAVVWLFIRYKLFRKFFDYYFGKDLFGIKFSHKLINKWAKEDLRIANIDKENAKDIIKHGSKEKADKAFREELKNNEYYVER